LIFTIVFLYWSGNQKHIFFWPDMQMWMTVHFIVSYFPIFFTEIHGSQEGSKNSQTLTNGTGTVILLLYPTPNNTGYHSNRMFLVLLLYTSTLVSNRFGGVFISMLTSSAVDCGFKPQSSKSKIMKLVFTDL
jgi:hypothetical protein